MYSKQYGFTLVEMLVVTALIAILLGVSSAFLTHFDRRFLLQKSTMEIASTLKIARNFSAQVEIDSQRGWIECRGTKLLGFWQFEDYVSTGFLSRNAVAREVSLAAGKIGNSFSFRLKGIVNCGQWTRTDLGNGFILSMWIYPEQMPFDSPHIVCQFGSLYQLQIKADQILYITIGDKDWAVVSMPLCRWTHLEIVDNLKNVSVSTDYLSNIAIPVTTDITKLDKTSLILGSRFYGRIDHVKLAALTVLETVILPEGIKILRAPRQILFDRYGHLDSLFHLSPEVIVLEGSRRDQKIQTQIVVSVTGNVDLINP